MSTRRACGPWRRMKVGWRWSCAMWVVLVCPSSADAGVHKVALLNGAQEATPVVTPAWGCGRFQIDTEANTMTYHISFSGLLGNEAKTHFHAPGGPGDIAGVVHVLPMGNPKTGTWNYPEALEADILAGRCYVNLHTSVHLNGEIRGQIVDMVAEINGIQENPPSGSAGGGYGLFNIDTCQNELNYHITVEALDGVENAAHIHGYTLHTGNAGVVHTLPAGTPKVGTWTYPESREAEILNGQTYVNIHSNLFPAGEIRGQIVRVVAPMDSAQEVPPFTEPGHGCALFAHDPIGNVLSYFIEYDNLTGPAMAAHIHGYAPAGGIAGVVHSIGTANPVVNAWSYPAADEPNILAGLTYVNVHTAAHGGGEIRGQVLFPKPCPPDFNCDCEVNSLDLAQLLGSWGPCPPPCPPDLSGNGLVTAEDLALLLGSWGSCP